MLAKFLRASAISENKSNPSGVGLNIFCSCQAKLQPLLHSLLMLLSLLVGRYPQHWTHGGSNVVLLLLMQMPRSHQQLVS